MTSEDDRERDSRRESADVPQHDRPETKAVPPAPLQPSNLSPRTATELERLNAFIELIEDRVPAGYRRLVFRAVAPRILTEPEAGLQRRTPITVPRRSLELDAALYNPILSSSGKTLLKSLVALHAAQRQLGLAWMTPAEIERFLVERARVRRIYRTNISNALRDARELVNRRRRKRAYEYALTERGELRVLRELRLLGLE